MSKSMYSLILNDDVVRAVDRMAYEQGMSRSALINHILAQRLSLTTPESRIADIFSVITAVAEQHSLQIPARPSGNMLQVKSVLRYRYNPTIRYTVELAPEQDACVGSFRAVSRTQSESLQSMLSVFFELWAHTEHYCCAQAERDPPRYEIAPGRYRRSFLLPPEAASGNLEPAGTAIGDYIRLFDQSLDLYFSARTGEEAIVYKRIAELYLTWMEQTSIAL